MNQKIQKNTSIPKVLELGSNCKQCGNCCNYGSGILIQKDIERIAKYLNLTKKEFAIKHLEKITKFNTTLHRFKTKKPYSKCFFIKNRKCTIHKVKPLHCRISNCDNGEETSVWFHLNYFVNAADPESIRQWASYLKAKGKNIPGGTLKELVPNNQKLKKILNYEVLKWE